MIQKWLVLILNYIDDNFFNKSDPAVNGHCHNTTSKQYNEDIHNIFNIDKSKSHNIKNHRYTGDHYYNKKQSITNNFTNYITKRNSINDTENILHVLKAFLRRIT